MDAYRHREVPGGRFLNRRLVLDPATGRYHYGLTPSTGRDTLFDFYARSLHGTATVDRGEHAVLQ